MPKKLDGLSIAHKIAKEKGGKCLSNIYKNSRIKMLWMCKNNHKWWARLSDIMYKKSWCAACSGIKRLSGIDVARQIAKIHNGKCLSNTYDNNKQKLLWQCENKHTWYARLNNIKNHHQWCPECKKAILSDCHRLENGLAVVKQIISDRGGICLSTEYVNNKSKLKVKCKNNHIWTTTLKKLRYHWCPDCGYLEAAKKANNACVLLHWKTKAEIVCVGSYEKSTIEYLNTNKINFRWQNKIFTMPDGRTYRPDLYINKKWIEIKGYFWGDAKEKWEWFHNAYPNSELWDKKKLKEKGILKGD